MFWCSLHSCNRAWCPDVKDGLHMKRFISKFWADESGATAIEYGLIAAGISIAIITVVNGLGTNLNTKFSDINNSLK
jgi:pilus assembly protein Flp/PilA